MLKKRILSVCLILAMLLICVPFAFAQTAGPIADYGCIALPRRPGDLDRMVFFTLAQGYTALTETFRVVIRYEDYDVPVTEDQMREYTADASQVETVQIPYYENGTHQTRLQCFVPFERLSGIVSVEIPAGSFAYVDGSASPAASFNRPQLLFHSTPFNCRSKVMQDTISLNGGLDVGVGDQIVLSCELPVPVSVWLDGEKKADLDAHTPAGTSFTMDTEGTHTVQLRVMGAEFSSQTFRVVPQMQVYKDQLGAVTEDVGLLFLAPLAAPVAFVIMPPAGIAAALAPLFAGGGIIEVFAAVFRVFNLLKR